MIEECRVIDTCDEQKTDMEKEYPRKMECQNCQFVLNKIFQRQSVKLNEDGCDMFFTWIYEYEFLSSHLS